MRLCIFFNVCAQCTSRNCVYIHWGHGMVQWQYIQSTVFPCFVKLFYLFRRLWNVYPGTVQQWVLWMHAGLGGIWLWNKRYFGISKMWDVWLYLIGFFHWDFIFRQDCHLDILSLNFWGKFTYHNRTKLVMSFLVLLFFYKCKWCIMTGIK